jgi:hypothetical protein
MAGLIGKCGTHCALLVIRISNAIVCLAIIWICCRTGRTNDDSGLGLRTGSPLLRLSYQKSYGAIGSMGPGLSVRHSTSQVSEEPKAREQREKSGVASTRTHLQLSKKS